MVKTIVITDGLGKYGKVAGNIVKHLGYNLMILDENKSRWSDVDFTSYDQIKDLDDEFAVWALSDKATKYFNNDKHEFRCKLLYTKVNDVNEYINKMLVKHFEVAGVKTLKPKFIDDNIIIKPREGAGSNPFNGRMLVTSGNRYYCVNKLEIEDNVEFVCRYSKGKRIYALGYNCMNWENGDILDKRLNISEYLPHLEYMDKLAEYYEVDGFIDSEFIFNGFSWYWIESNPRTNLYSYHNCKQEIINWLKGELK